MIQILIIEILVAVAAWMLGRHDAPACDNFYQFGATVTQQKLFHSSNWKIKFFIAVLGTFAVFQFGILTMALAGVAFICILWPLFNISLNLARKNPVRSWDYISTNSNQTDSWLTKRFSDKGGRYLTYTCAVIFVALNIIMGLINGLGTYIVWLG